MAVKYTSMMEVYRGDVFYQLDPNEIPSVKYDVWANTRQGPNGEILLACLCAWPIETDSGKVYIHRPSANSRLHLDVIGDEGDLLCGGKIDRVAPIIEAAKDLMRYACEHEKDFLTKQEILAIDENGVGERNVKYYIVEPDEDVLNKWTIKSTISPEEASNCVAAKKYDGERVDFLLAGPMGEHDFFVEIYRAVDGHLYVEHDGYYGSFGWFEAQMQKRYRNSQYAETYRKLIEYARVVMGEFKEVVPTNGIQTGDPGPAAGTE